VHAKAGTRQLAVRRLVSAVHGACITMRASSLVVTLHASFASRTAARSRDSLSACNMLQFDC